MFPVSTSVIRSISSGAFFLKFSPHFLLLFFAFLRCVMCTHVVPSVCPSVLYVLSSPRFMRGGDLVFTSFSSALSKCLAPRTVGGIGSVAGFALLVFDCRVVFGSVCLVSCGAPAFRVGRIHARIGEAPKPMAFFLPARLASLLAGKRGAHLAIDAAGASLDRNSTHMAPRVVRCQYLSFCRERLQKTWPWKNQGHVAVLLV